MTTAGEIGELLVEELERVERMMCTDEWLCPCGPAWVLDDATVWTYTTGPLGWHNPHTPHAALWPVS